jgi:hypothetical protein
LPLVVARCAPNTKVRMVDALHRRNAFVAMSKQLFSLNPLSRTKTNSIVSPNSWRWCQRLAFVSA